MYSNNFTNITRSQNSEINNHFKRVKLETDSMKYYTPYDDLKIDKYTFLDDYFPKLQFQITKS